ncbi:MAG: hypothetical protein ACTSUT_07700, partial [Promethearchaeota archaeon]
MQKKNKNEIVVLGQKIETRIEDIDIYKLKYWKENPRVNAIIKQKYRDKDVFDEDIEKELWEKESVKDLFKDIEWHGGLIEEILVQNNVVLEGNSRLCAYRHLYKKAEKHNDEDKMLTWSYIRARIIPNDISNEVVFSILGTWHIKGKAKWDTFEKASYLKRMNVEYKYPYKQIADSISQTEKFVKDNIKAHDLMVESNVYTLDKFSYFYELVKNNNINILANKESTIIPNTIKAIKEDRFKRAEEIRDLHKVLKDKKAKKEFFEEEVEFREAFETAKDRHPENADSFY